MRVLCQIVVHNEADRYWDSWLDWHVPIFGAENIHVYDDHSSDDTVAMALDAGVGVTCHGQAAGPRFLEHEGRFRQAAWDAMEAQLNPAAGDWVFCLDADEFLVARDDEQGAVYRACEWANAQRRGAYIVSIPEIFRTDLDDDGKLSNPQIRIDGWWGKIAGTRLFAWNPGGKFADRPMGCGSEPSYAVTAPRSSLQNMWVLHYGYARPEDAMAKYERYTDRQGHSSQHVESIIAAPNLVPWDGPLVDVYLGRRPAPGPGAEISIPFTPIADQEPADDDWLTEKGSTWET